MEPRVGIIGWNYPEWRGLVYPEHAKPESFLRHYAERYPGVEVAASYYKFPEAEKIRAWVEETPPGFGFSMKVPDWITKKPTAPEVPERIGWFLDRVAPLRDAGKLGVLVAQFPPFFRRDKKADDLEAFVKLLPKGPAWAIELRHASWWHPDTYRLLEDAGVTLVWSVIESGRTPPMVTSDRVYMRLFGDRSLAKPYATKRRDMTEELAFWAEALRVEGTSAREADVMISKYLEGYAPASVETMRGLLGIEEAHPSARQTTLGV